MVECQADQPDQEASRSTHTKIARDSCTTRTRIISNWSAMHTSALHILEVGATQLTIYRAAGGDGTMESRYSE